MYYKKMLTSDAVSLQGDGLTSQIFKYAPAAKKAG
jgi:hypothetical protein